MSIISQAREGKVFIDTGFRLAPRIEEYLKSLKGTVSERGVGYHHPSSLAGCTRNLFYCRSGIPGRENTELNLRLRFDTGHAVHGQLNKYVAAMYPEDEAQTDVPLSLPGLYLGGEADMIVWGKVVIDFKTAATKSFSKVRPPIITPEGEVRPSSMKGYVWQVHAYMAMSDIPMALILYYNKDNSRIMEVPVPFNLRVWEQIEQKIDTVEAAFETGEVPEREIDPFFCKNMCAYFAECKPGV